MTLHYYSSLGGRWPSNGGASWAGFTGLDARFNALLGLFQPRMGADLGGVPVPPGVAPFFDTFDWAWDDVADTYGIAGYGGNPMWRIFVTPPGGAETLIYSLGNPYFVQYHVADPPTHLVDWWTYELDVASPYYMAAPAGWLAGWSWAETYSNPAYFHPGSDDYLSPRRYTLTKTPVTWDVGEWTIRFVSQSKVFNTSSATYLLEVQDVDVSWSFTVAEEGGGSYDLEADIETTPGWCPSYVVGGSVPANAAPVISNVSPAAGTGLAQSGHVSFDVTDDSGLLRRVGIKAEFFSETTVILRELPWDGDTFDPLYTGSTVAAIAGGYHFDLVRLGGWPVVPAITVYAIDQQGAESA